MTEALSADAHHHLLRNFSLHQPPATTETTHQRAFSDLSHHRNPNLSAHLHRLHHNPPDPNYRTQRLCTTLSISNLAFRTQGLYQKSMPPGRSVLVYSPPSLASRLLRCTSIIDAKCVTDLPSHQLQSQYSLK